MFKKISIKRWRQFNAIDIDFHKNLTVITGANGAGKTTILALLSRHFGWNIQFASTPRAAKRGLVQYYSDAHNEKDGHQGNVQNGKTIIGKVFYTEGKDPATITVPQNVGQQYNVELQNQKSIGGIYVSSHRPLYFYQQVQQIPAKLDAKNQLLQKYLNELKQRYNQNSKNTSASYRIKESIIALATFGYGNQVVASDSDAIEMFEDFEEVLRTILPESLGFQRIIIHMPEVVLETRTGSFSFDSASGGIASLIDLSWQILLAFKIYGNLTVVIDEPENHLHPKLQRLLLPNLIKAFPTVQFIVATHNPFMVTSVPESNVYVLDYSENGLVDSHLLDLVNRSGTSNEILREVLGLESTLPVWAESELDGIINYFSGKTIDKDALVELKNKLHAIGLDELFPEAIEKISERLK